MNARYASVAVAAITAIGMVSTSFASEISVHFYDTNTAVGSGESAGAPDAASNGYWNNWSVSSGSGTLSGVSDSTDTLVSGDSISYSNADFENNKTVSPTDQSSAANWNSPSTGDLQLFAGSIGSNTSQTGTSTVNVTLTNIPYASYEVYVYFQGSKGSGPNLWSIYDSGSGLTYYWLGDQSSGAQSTLKAYTSTSDQNSGTATAANYAVFSEIGGPSTSDTISLPNPYSTGDGTSFYGLQIVQTPEPPACGALVAVGTLGMLRRRRTGSRT